MGLYGLTYKENVDDIRESPMLQLIECMKKHLASGIRVYDPISRYVFSTTLVISAVLISVKNISPLQKVLYKSSIKEEGLEELFHGARKNGIEFSEKYHKADIYIVAVPTPYIKRSKKVDTTYIIS